MSVVSIDREGMRIWNQLARCPRVWAPQGRIRVNRTAIFNACEQKLTLLCYRVELRGRLNILDLNIHCEDFYAGLLNLLYSYQLKNVNAYNHNAEGIDLVDSTSKIVLQVSSTATKQKVSSALGKDLSAYKDHSFRFMSISKDASHLRKETYTNPHGLVFDPSNDIYDVAALLKVILHMRLPQQRKVYDFLKDELGEERLKEESNLAAVINIITKEDLNGVSLGAPAIDFNVDDKVTFNGLQGAAGVVADYSLFHHVVDRIYAEFDNAGINKSKSVLDAFRTTYHKLAVSYSGDELFFQIVEEVIKKVQDSSNYTLIPVDELQLCVNILAVDAFIRCKIFKNPGATYVAA